MLILCSRNGNVLTLKLMIPKWTKDHLMESSVSCRCFYKNLILPVPSVPRLFTNLFKVPQRSMKIKIYIPKSLHLISDWDWLRDYKNVKIKSNVIPVFYSNLNIYVTKLA